MRTGRVSEPVSGQRNASPQRYIVKHDFAGPATDKCHPYTLPDDAGIDSSSAVFALTGKSIPPRSHARCRTVQAENIGVPEY